MATKPILQAELALADLAEHFEHWRRSRATVQERIPQPLWDQAVVLTTVLPGSQVAKRLRLSPTDLKKQCLARHRRPLAAGASPARLAGRSTGRGGTGTVPTPPEGVRLGRLTGG